MRQGGYDVSPQAAITGAFFARGWRIASRAGAYNLYAFALANDGYMLAGNPNAMYRISPAGSAWESLGSIPVVGAVWYVYQPGAGVGLIWALPQTSDFNAPASSVVYVATYA